MPRFDPIERSIAELGQSIRGIEAAIGRLAQQHEGTWGQVQDIDARGAHDRASLAAVRDEAADLARGWLQLRTGLKRLQPATPGRTLAIDPVAATVAVDGGPPESADLAALPYPPASVDAIVVTGLADPALTALWHSLLCKGGTLTFVKHPPSP